MSGCALSGCFTARGFPGFRAGAAVLALGAGALAVGGVAGFATTGMGTITTGTAVGPGPPEALGAALPAPPLLFALPVPGKADVVGRCATGALLPEAEGVFVGGVLVVGAGIKGTYTGTAVTAVGTALGFAGSRAAGAAGAVLAGGAAATGRSAGAALLGELGPV